MLLSKFLAIFLRFCVWILIVPFLVYTAFNLQTLDHPFSLIFELDRFDEDAQIFIIGSILYCICSPILAASLLFDHKITSNISLVPLSSLSAIGLILTVAEKVKYDEIKNISINYIAHFLIYGLVVLVYGIDYLNNGKEIRKAGYIGFVSAMLSIPFQIAIFGVVFQRCGLYINAERDISHTFSASLYFSGITFFTVGYGDVLPSESCRFWAVFEAFCGTITTALVIASIVQFLNLRENKMRHSRN